MSRHIHHIKYIFIVLLFFASAGGGMALAQQIMTPLSGPTDSKESVVNQQDSRIEDLQLGIFEKAAGAPSSCGNNCEDMTDQVLWVQAWSCVAKACDNGGQKGPASCLEHFIGQLDLSKKELMNTLICNMVKSPGTKTRQALMKAFPSAQEDGYVEGMSFMYAFQGNVTACQDQIKNYVGPYGPAWNLRWYKDMSGCRILAMQRTRAEEEKDFSAWLGGNCSTILNAEMRNACYAPGALFPNA
jgi:hypothetical protein